MRNGRLEDALAALIQNQVSFLAQVSDMDRQIRDLERVNSERFARIEAILLRHEQLLQALPDAIKEKIGFKAPGN